MGTPAKLLLWWILFGGTHIVGSMVPVRALLIRWLSLRGFKALYSLVAFATFIPLCIAFATDKHAGSLIYTPGPVLHWLAQGLMFLSLFVLLQALLTASPLTTAAEMTGRLGSGARGIQRVTRHPQLLAFRLFAIAHALVNPYPGDWVFFGGFLAFAVLSGIHQDRRMAATGPEAARRLLAETSHVPFAAILAGRQRLALREYSLAGLVVSTALFFLLRSFHHAWFGGMVA